MGRRGRGEGAIWRRSDGRWEGRLDLGIVDGRRRRRVVYGRSRAEVASKLGELARAREAGALPTEPSVKLEVYLAAWLASIEHQVRPGTLRSDAMYVRRHVVPALGRIRLDRLSLAQVQAFLDAKCEAGLAPQTVIHLRGILRRALNQAIRLGLLSRNVAALARPPRLERFEFKPFTPDEARSFLRAIEHDRLRELYVVALFGGLRRGELLGLRWADVDLDEAQLRVDAALQRVASRLVLVPPKTARSRRTVSLPAMAVEALRQHKAAQAKERLRAGSEWADNGLVFTTQTGAPIEPRNATRGFKRVLARAGIREIRFHDLRHSCATLLLVQGVSPRVVMEMLGHSQISLTMNTYSHVLPALQREAAARLEALLGSDQ